MKLNEWGTEWMRRRATDGIHRNSQDEALTWKLRIEGSAIGSMQVAEVTPQHVRQWVRLQVTTPSRRTGKRHARQTIVNALNCLRVCLRDAAEEGLIVSNPAHEVRVPKMPRTTEGWTYLSMAEIERLERCAELKREHRNAILFTLYTGLRSGEVWGLRWNDVDLVQGFITVRHSFNGPTKSGRVRQVPLLPKASAALADQRKVSRGHLVFPNRRGGMRAKGYDAQLRTNLRLAAIGRRIRFHDLRHSCASHLVMGSWGRAWRIEEVKELLGHTSISVTQRYAHLSFGGIMQAAKETIVVAAE